jgi:hypothetical protein
MSMNRALVNIVIDLVSALLFLAMLATGYLLRFPLPPGSNKLYSVWGLSRHEWGDIHFWISLALIVSMIVHLALHWNWVVTVIGKRCGLVNTSQPPLFRCAAWTIVVFTGICLGFAWIIDISVKETERPRRGRNALARESTPLGSTKASTNMPQTQSPDWQAIYPIFQTHCLACHGPTLQAANFRVDRRDDYFKPESKLVVPGNSTDSPLFAIVSGERRSMPAAEKHILPADDIARIKDWIDQGAK